MVDVRPDAREIGSEIFEPDGDQVHAARIRGEEASRVKPRLLDLIVRRESDFEIQIQAPPPERNHPCQRLGGKRRANAETKYGIQIRIVAQAFLSVFSRLEAAFIPTE